MMRSEIWSFILLTCSALAYDLRKLLDLEITLIQNADFLITQTENKILEMKRSIELYKHDNRVAAKNMKEHLNSPLSNYILIKRLLSEWESLEDTFTTLLDGFDETMKKMKKDENFPTKADLGSAMEALNTLHDVYQVNITSLASGVFEGVRYASYLSASDCFEIGKHSFQASDFYHAKRWIAEAVKRLEVGCTTQPNKWELLELQAFVAHKLGNNIEANSINEALLKIKPDHPRAIDNRRYYSSNMVNYVSQGDEVDEDEDQRKMRIIYETYKKLCRNATGLSTHISSQLKCRYITNNIPFLRIAPIKEEDAYLNPRITVYRDVIYDSEIQRLKNMTIPKLSRAQVLSKTGAITSKTRTAKLAWLHDSEDSILPVISARVEDITRLSTTTSELYQVANYGIGGQYTPHHDYTPFVPGTYSLDGDRIATLIFYMNDVVEGGATVFPHLNVRIFPRKGSALFWMNMHPDGAADERTLHGSCPVAVGTKWICNKWFHERDQEFRRPCDLTPTAI